MIVEVTADVVQSKSNYSCKAVALQEKFLPHKTLTVYNAQKLAGLK